MCVYNSLSLTYVFILTVHTIKGKIMMLVSFPIITISISKGIQTSFSFKEASISYEGQHHVRDDEV